MSSKQEYSDEFKLTVIRNYLQSPHGIRVVARSFDLPSKNYITNWMKYLVKKGLLNPNECFIKTQSFVDKPLPCHSDAQTAKERHLQAENLRLRAEVALLKKLKELERRDAKGK